MSEDKDKSLSINQETMDILITNIIPTSKYFEVRFDNLEQKFDHKFEQTQLQIENLDKKFEHKFEFLEHKVDNLDLDINNLKSEMYKRFEQVDKRFEQVDKRFEQVDVKLDKILERIDVKIDNGLRENRSYSLRLFTFAMTFSAVSMVGFMGKMFEIF